MNSLKVIDLINNFNLEVLAGSSKVDSKIQVYGINRAGLELTGYFEEGKKSHRIILMSTKESTYILNFSKEDREKRYKELFEKEIPAFIITEKFEDDLVIKIAKEMDILLLKTSSTSTSDFTQHVLEFMDDYFAPQDEIHASLVNIFGKGVLLIGESGIGKSEITLELVNNNHLFVGDDRIIVTKKHSQIYGKSHEILKNLVEVRGIGIIDVSKTHGYQVILNQSKIDIVIELMQFKKNGVDDSDRLGNDFNSYNILDEKIPYLKIPVSSGRNISNIIETAVSKLKIKESGEYKDAATLLTERAMNYDNG